VTEGRADIARLLASRLCGKLYLKAETQQVDRILEQFSRRYFDDNPRTVYGSSGALPRVSLLSSLPS